MRISPTTVGMTLAALAISVTVSASPSIAVVRDPGPQAYIGSSWLAKCPDWSKCSKRCPAELCQRTLTDRLTRGMSGKRA